jgi:ATP-dependent helicase HepA
MSKEFRYLPGQRFISMTEPELGLGVVVAADRRYVEMAFSKSDCKRKYGISSAPLQRVVFKAGDTIKDSNGQEHQITSIDDNDPSGKIFYICSDEKIGEDIIAESGNGISQPLRRLLNRISDRTHEFELRLNLLHLQQKILKSPVRGFVGARMKLLPHQLFIASEVSSRRRIRVLLADETGLGKTIEACLIMHRMILTGRVQRCLVCVPESLTHQWFIELLRRFNLMFTLFSNEHFESCNPNENPFENIPFGIISIQILTQKTFLLDFAAGLAWDMIIVDEAHHLRFGTREYDSIRRLSEKTQGIILLSATPEQYGLKDHFLRLQLLDPARYTDYNEFLLEMKKFQNLSESVRTELLKKNINLENISLDRVILDTPQNLNVNGTASMQPTFSQDRKMTLSQIIDFFGPGRAIFRNTRRVISGFPKRLVSIIALSGNEAAQKNVNKEFQGLFNDKVTQFGPISKEDPRILCILDLLKENQSDKFLVICSAKEKAKFIQEALAAHLNIKIALFHEDMTLVQRDRNAAWFTESDGARVLICSEIGSEGRNFQCCRNLVLFDLPFEPEVLEQRIGRLDRIGQGPIINIYTPFVIGTFQELLCRWYHEGLGAFQNNVPAAGRVWEEVRETMQSFAKVGFPTPEILSAFITKSAELCARYSREYIDDRDYLLEISSFQPEAARHLIEAIVNAHDHHLPAVMDLLFKQYGILSEKFSDGKWHLTTDYVTDSRFPLTRQENPLITYERETALSREDIAFITIDHPMVINAIDLFLSSDQGTSVFALWEDANAHEIFLESLYVLECVAPPTLYASRFLSPTPIRIMVNEKGENVSDRYPMELLDSVLTDAPLDALFGDDDLAAEKITKMQSLARTMAKKISEPLIETSVKSMEKMLAIEIDRLVYLQQLNHSISPIEINQCQLEKAGLETHLNNSQIRLDSVRVILHVNRRS